MKIMMTGATGLVGGALARRLARDGHELTALVRSEAAARERLGPEVRLVVDDGTDTAIGRALAGAAVVVHLSGEPLIGGRWTDARKARFRESRIGLAQRLINRMRAGPERPQAFVSASAVGYFGDRGDEILTEDSGSGGGYLGELCREWEAAALAAKDVGARVVTVRIGVVLAARGGALEKMRLPFQLGLGGRIGSGRQWMPWIHIDDLVEIFVRAITDPSLHGAVNATAPEPVTNAELTRSLARALRRPAFALVPATVLRLAMGGAAEVLLSSQRVRPAVLESIGFRHRFRTIDEAMNDILRSGAPS